jgi:Reverse transcriptase (RNA-dependent DNA polymerase)
VKRSINSSIFIKHSCSTTIIVLVYVDNIIITENNETKIENVKNYPKNKFDIKDLGKINYFLGIENNTFERRKFIFISNKICS